MPLTFDNRSCAVIAPRGVMAFSGRDGHKEVCCLLPLLLLERHCATHPTPDALARAFARYRARFERRASRLYDRYGSDECGEVLLTALD